MYEKINYGGWPNCIRLSNGEIELIATTDVGPRIVHIGFISKQNFFYLSPADKGRTGGNDWRIYGGHRLWLAPEKLTLSYAPDNAAVNFSVNDDRLILTQDREPESGIVKEMEISLSPVTNQVTVVHRLINQSLFPIEVAPWSLSALAPGGRAIIPNEPFGEGNDYLLPARSIALWHYTKMNDSRWIWGDRYIQARQETSLVSEQKIGIMNKQQWIAYCLNGEMLIKQFEFSEKAQYPDFGSNNEVYINGDFLEIETLGALTEIQPEGIVEHTEKWLLAATGASEEEASIDANVLPLLQLL